MLQLLAIGKLAIGFDIICTTCQIHRTCGNIEVLRCDDTTDRLDRQTKCLDSLRIDIDLNLAHGLTNDTHRTDTIHTIQHIDQTVVQNLVHCVIALIGRNREHHYGHHRRTELENRRIIHLVGQQGLSTADNVAHVIHRYIKVRTPLHFERNHRHVILRCRGDLFQIIDRVKLVFQHSGNICFDIGCISSCIDRRYGDVGRVHFGILVDRQILQREESEDDHTQEEQTGRNRLSNG